MASVIAARRRLMRRAALAENFAAAERHQKHAAILYSELLAGFTLEFGSTFDRETFDRLCGMHPYQTSTG